MPDEPITIENLIAEIDRSIGFCHIKQEHGTYAYVRRDRALGEFKEVLDKYIEQRVLFLLEQRFGLLPSPVETKKD